MYLKQHRTPEEVFQTLQEEERDQQFREGHHLETPRSPDLLRFCELKILHHLMLNLADYLR